MTTDGSRIIESTGSGLELDEHELHALSAHATVESVAARTVIVNEGDQSGSIFVIIAGRVKVFLHNADGKEVVLNVLGPGEYFGEVSLDEGPRSASVMTMEASRLLIVAKADFKALLSANPEFAIKLITRLTRRVRALTENVRSLALMDVYGRVARLLLELATTQNGKLIITEKLTQREIAERIGSSREMVSRIFKDLVAGGYLHIEDRQIIIERDLPERW